MLSQILKIKLPSQSHIHVSCVLHAHDEIYILPGNQTSVQKVEGYD